jgi:predicted ABC-type ATPase
MSETNPQIIVIAGPNGAGKTSLSPFLLRDRSGEFPFVNADTIASGLSAFEPETVAIEAGRVMLNRFHELAERHESFAFESTLAARSYAPWLTRLRQQGYEVYLLFVWLRSVDLAIERVAERVRRGGHHIPSPELRRRYKLGIANLFDLYMPLVDAWAVYDNSDRDQAALVATGVSKGRPKVSRPDLWKMLLESHEQK